MNRLTTYKYLLFIFLNVLYACNQPIMSKDLGRTQVNDSIFIISNIQNLDFIDSLNWDFENLYFDTLKTQKFEKLSNALKLKYLKEFLKNEDGTEIQKDWIEDDLQAFIIGTRPPIGNFQPTIIKIYGTDYAAVIIVNIDESGNIISGYPIYALENSGPQYGDDTMVITRPKTKCKFVNNSILTSRLVGTCYPQNGAVQEFSIKQINFKTTISESGEITTMKLDSSQYKMNCKMDYFQSY